MIRHVSKRADAEGAAAFDQLLAKAYDGVPDQALRRASHSLDARLSKLPNRRNLEMKCFVASAFDREDVDDIYDHALIPVLRDLKVSASRANRVEHNDDIDDKIFELLNAADICIADLTYARPSVYYEAGYAAAAKKPVIYIVRADHLRPAVDDRFGTFRVHFDLQMKNIIVWTRPNEQFKAALRRRLRHVIRPMQHAHKLSETTVAARETFSHLPLNRRIEAILEKGTRLLYRRGFENVGVDHSVVHSYNRVHVDRHKKRVHQQVHLVARRSITKDDFYRIQRHSFIPFVTMDEIRKTSDFQSLLIFAVLSTVPSTRLETLLPNYERISEGIFQRSEVRGLHGLPATVIITAIDTIRSVEEFAKRFVGLLADRGFD